MNKAFGIDIHGNKLFFSDIGRDIQQLKFLKKISTVICHNKYLIELELTDGVEHLQCWNNKFNRNLSLPESIKTVVCDDKALDNLNKYKHINQIYIHY